MNLHHIFGILGVWYLFFSNKFGNGFLYGMFFFELSNPFILLNKNFLIYEIHPKLGHLFKLIFAGIFIYGRTYIIFKILDTFNKEYLSLTILILLGLNWHVSLNWIIIIIYKLFGIIVDYSNINFLRNILKKWKNIKNSYIYLIFLHIILISICYYKIFWGSYTYFI